MDGATTWMRIGAGLIALTLVSPALAQVPPAALADPRAGIALPPPPATRMAPPPLQAPGTPPGRTVPAPPSALAPIQPAAPTKTVLGLSAVYGESGPAVASGLRWRIFSDATDINRNFPLVAETTNASEMLTLDPGGYIVHVTYGHVTQTRHVVLGTSSENLRFVLNAGALRFSGKLGGNPIPGKDLRFDLFKIEGGVETPIASNIPEGKVLRLEAGMYQVSSTFGGANARIVSEVKVEPGKLTDTTVHHRAGRVQLRLKPAAGSSPPGRDIAWSVLTPGGDTVTESAGERSDAVLAEGEYIAVARYNGQTYQAPFAVKSGTAVDVDVPMQRK